MSEQATWLAPPEPAPQGWAPEDDLVPDSRNSLLEILTQLARSKWIIVRLTGAASMLGLVFAFALPVRYTASTKLMPPQQSPSTAMAMMNQLSPAATNTLATLAGGLGMRNPNDLYVGLLRSRPIADAIIDKFALMKVYKASDRTQARRKLAEATDIDSDKGGFITVAVTDRDRQRAADMANEYVAQLRLLTKEVAVTEAAERRLFYDEQLKSAKESLVAAEFAFQKVQQSSGIVQPDAQSKAMIESLAGLRAEVTAKTIELEALRSYSTDRNPQVELAENELASLKAAQARLEQNGGSGFSELGLKEVPGAGMEYLSAQHEVLYRQTVFDLLIRQDDIARLDEAKEAAIIQVVEPAAPPERRSAPGRAKILFLFTLFGFLAACLYSHMKIRIRESIELRAALGNLRSALFSR